MTTHIRASAVDPDRLIAALVEAGHQLVGRSRGGYVRLARPGEEPPRGSLVIPTDRTVEDYLELMAAVLGDLEVVAHRGEDVAAVLALLAGQQPTVPDEPDPLDHAMWEVYLEGQWRWVTSRMDTETREAAVAAVIRYDRWLQRTQGDPPSPRSYFAWWEN